MRNNTASVNNNAYLPAYFSGKPGKVSGKLLCYQLAGRNFAAINSFEGVNKVLF